MRITVNHRTIFLFPTRLVVNRLTTGFIRRKLEKQGISLTRKQALLFVKELRRYKKHHPEWNLIEVEDKDGGESVTIKV